MLNGVLVRVFGLPPFVATYGMMWIANGVAMILMQGKIIFGLPDNFLWLGSGYLSIVPIPVIIAALVAVGFPFLFEEDGFRPGNLLPLAPIVRRRATRGSRSIKTIVTGLQLEWINGGHSGNYHDGRLDAAQEGMGEPFMLQAIAAVVMGGSSLMGGEGGIPGTVIGALDPNARGERIEPYGRVVDGASHGHRGGDFDGSLFRHCYAKMVRLDWVCLVRLPLVISERLILHCLLDAVLSSTDRIYDGYREDF